MTNQEFELINHSTMHYVETFLVEMHSRSIHGHSDLEIALVVQGELDLLLEHRRLRLHEGDIYIINHDQLHGFQEKDSQNLIMAFQIPFSLVRDLCPLIRNLRFDDNVIPEGPLKIEVRNLLFQCFSHYFSEDLYKELDCTSMILQLLHLLLTDFPVHRFTESELQVYRNQTQHINHVTEYIETHYQEKASLAELAEEEHLSLYYLSHLIRRVLGSSFRDYLNHYRFEHALYMINSGKKYSLLEIAIDSGFSSTRYLNQAFLEQTGMDAKTYQKSGSSVPASIQLIPSGNVQKRYSYDECAAYLKRHPELFS